jgi:hypothetical protein
VGTQGGHQSAAAQYDTRLPLGRLGVAHRDDRQRPLFRSTEAGGITSDGCLPPHTSARPDKACDQPTSPKSGSEPRRPGATRSTDQRGRRAFKTAVALIHPGDAAAGPYTRAARRSSTIRTPAPAQCDQTPSTGAIQSSPWRRSLVPQTCPTCPTQGHDTVVNGKQRSSAVNTETRSDLPKHAGEEWG